MKKALVLISLAPLAAISLGCALTDYPSMGVINKSHGVIRCETDDRMANAQQTIEGGTRELLYTEQGPTGTVCPGFDPSVTLDNVSHEDARDWNRFIGSYAFTIEVQVFGVPGGTWLMAGAKDLADGATRINTFYTPNTGAFSCVGDNVDGRYGGPEGTVVGDFAGRLPGLHVETIAIDRSNTGIGFCQNLVATSVHRATEGYSTYVGALGRFGEGRLIATPITRRAGLASFLAGGTETVTVQGVQITGKGQLNPDGTITLTLLGLQNDLASYQAENALTVTVNPANNFRTIKIENTSDAELGKLAEFALAADLAGRPIDLSGTQVPEFGLVLPDRTIELNPSFLQKLIDNAANPSDGFGG